MSATSTQIDEATLEIVQDLIRTNLVSRDGLYAAADKLDGPALQKVCRRLADELAGHVADLQQLVLRYGQKPVGPEDWFVQKLRSVVLEVLQQQPSSQHVVIEAEGRERWLKKEYDAAIEQARDGQIKGLLHLQRKNAEFGGEVLEAIEELHRATDNPRDAEAAPAGALPHDDKADGFRQPREETIHRFQAGDTYRCEKCGMRIAIIVACNCPDAITPEFRCCGANMISTPPSSANETLTPEAERGDYIG